MEKDTYLVLRVSGAETKSFDVLESLSYRTTTPSELAPELDYKVDAQVLDDKDYRELRRDREVVGIARPIPVQLIEPVSAEGPNAEPEHLHGATWGVYVTGALQSPHIGRGVTVAVLDTGIDATHEAFRGIDLVQKDFTGEGDGDQNGHGTHVAGTIFGQSVPGSPRYSVAPGVRRALIGKVVGTKRSTTTKELMDAIQWAVDGGAHVINLSLGFNFPGLVKRLTTELGMPVELATSRALAEYRDNIRFFDRMLELLRARAARFNSALLVAAAGNESKRDLKPDYTIDVSPPAAAEGILSVAALGTGGAPHTSLTVAPFSNIRAAVAAPGVGVYSARRGGGYTYLAGTSMASPHVTGVAALWAERQLKRGGPVNVSTLDAQLRGRTRQDCLPGASYLDVGEGLISAPVD
jgi:subtilisin family serine protease